MHPAYHCAPNGGQGSFCPSGSRRLSCVLVFATMSSPPNVSVRLRYSSLLRRTPSLSLSLSPLSMVLAPSPFVGSPVDPFGLLAYLADESGRVERGGRRAWKQAQHWEKTGGGAVRAVGRRTFGRICNSYNTHTPIIASQPVPFSPSSMFWKGRGANLKLTNLNCPRKTTRQYRPHRTRWRQLPVLRDCRHRRRRRLRSDRRRRGSHG